MRVLLIVLLVACTPPPKNGGTAYLNMQPPAPPGFGEQYGFELLERVTGQACFGGGRVRVGTPSNLSVATAYWLGSEDVMRGVQDPITKEAIAAAVAKAASKILDLGGDSLVVTMVTSEPGEDNSVCATVRGRAVTLTSRSSHTSQPPESPSEDRPREESPTHAEGSDDEER
jgi:hypothetical protein